MFKLTSVYWDRIYVHLVLSAAENELETGPVRFFLLNSSDAVLAEFEIPEQTSHSVCLRLNVTNSGINRCIEAGRHRVIAARGETVLGPVICEESFDRMASWNNHFLHSNNAGCYSVNFLLDEAASLPELIIQICTISKGARKAKRLSSSLKKCVSAVFSGLFRRRRKHGKKTVLFISQMSDKLSSNLLAVYERMMERGLDKEFRIKSFLKAGTKLSLMGKLRRLILVSSADIILVDDFVAYFGKYPPESDVKLIQLWHAGIGFKGIGYSRWGHDGSPGPICAHRYYSYGISGSESLSHFYSEAFGILDEQVIPTGMPRMDRYLEPGAREAFTEAIYRQYPQLRGRQVILFAPTYRGLGLKTAFYPYEMIDFGALHRYCVENHAVVLFKMHPFVSAPVPIDEAYADRLLDLSTYPDINELFFVTDLLITDYSSCMYEYLLMKKPMLAYAFDKKQYASSRGFHRDYDSNVPGKVCEDFDSLMAALWEKDYEYEKVERFLSYYFSHLESGSSDRVIDWFLLDELPQEYRDALADRRARINEVRSLRLIRGGQDTWDGCRLVRP